MIDTILRSGKTSRTFKRTTPGNNLDQGSVNFPKFYETPINSSFILRNHDVRKTCELHFCVALSA
jgi:hypothetical protein